MDTNNPNEAIPQPSHRPACDGPTMRPQRMRMRINWHLVEPFLIHSALTDLPNSRTPSRRSLTTIEKQFPAALRIIAIVMKCGADTHKGQDWHAAPPHYHLARARQHIDLLATGDVGEPHLAHAAARLLMELERDSGASRNAELK